MRKGLQSNVSFLAAQFYQPRDAPRIRDVCECALLTHPHRRLQRTVPKEVCVERCW